MATQSKIHHYVPQHLLRNFTKSQDGQVFCFDKSTERSFSTNPKNICAENGFNTFKNGEEQTNFEERVGIYEKIYLPSLKKLLHTENLELLSQKDRYNISLFVALQKLRTKAVREAFLDLSENMAAHASRIYPNKNFDRGQFVPSNEELKLCGLHTVFANVRKFADMLANRDVFLLEAPENKTFVIGDNPVALHNDEDFGPYGNLGWGLKSIQIYLPISPKLSLCFWCQSILNKNSKTISQAIAEHCIEKGIDLDSENIEDITKNQISDELKGTLAEVQKLGEAVRTKRRLRASSENVDFCNHLQVLWASRYIVSKNDEFDIVSKMISDNEKYRTSLKPEFN